MTEVTEYTAMVDLMTDAKGKPGKKGYQEMKTYPAGSTVTDENFPRSIIRNWLKRGILERVEPEENDDQIPIEDGE